MRLICLAFGFIALFTVVPYLLGALVVNVASRKWQIDPAYRHPLIRWVVGVGIGSMLGKIAFLIIAAL